MGAAADVLPPPVADREERAEEPRHHHEEQHGANRVTPEAELRDQQTADDGPRGRDPQHDAPDLDRKQLEAVRVHEHEVDATDQVVEGRENDEREQPRRGPDRGNAAAQIDELLVPR